VSVGVAVGVAVGVSVGVGVAVAVGVSVGVGVGGTGVYNTVMVCQLDHLSHPSPTVTTQKLYSVPT